MYALDTDAARKADSGSNLINELGKYVGKFTQAEDIEASTGTRGVALSFESNAGQKTRLSIYTLKSDGTQIMGFQALMAILTCLSLRGIKPVPGTVTRWDSEQRKEVSQPGKVFPEMCNKPIGLLLETEDYLSNAGEPKTRMVLQGVFQAGTELTASEILDKKTTPEQLEKMVARLRHRPMKASGQRAAIPGSGSRSAAPAGGTGFDDMDDDIPFITSAFACDMTTSKQRRMAGYDY